MSLNKEIRLSDFFHSCKDKSTSLYQDFIFLLVEKKKKNHAALISGQELLSVEDQNFLNLWIDKKKEDYPIQYFINQVEFCGFSFHVEEGALIPRMETEEMLLRALKLIELKNLEVKKILDIGTGTGCLGISAALSLKESLEKVVLLEPSKEALKSLKVNVEELGDERFKISEEPFESSSLNEKFDLILSNPPYIELEDQDVENSVYKFEPHMALYGGDNPVELIVLWLNKAYDLLVNNGLLLFEYSHDQKQALEEKLGHLSPVFYKDSFGKDRYLSILKKEALNG